MGHESIRERYARQILDKEPANTRRKKHTTLDSSRQDMAGIVVKDRWTWFQKF